MKITRTIFLFSRFFTIALIACFACPAGFAISIGDLTLQSSLGEPLYAQVDLLLAQGEVIAATCLSLSATEEEGSFLPSGLTVSIDQSGRKVEIRSRKPFNELFATFRLKVKCRGIGSVSKVLTLLPEFGTTPVPPVAAIAVLSNETETPSAAVQNETSGISEQPVVSNTPSVPRFRKPATVVGAETHQHIEISTSGQELSQRQSKATSKRASNKHKKPITQFRLKLSGEPLDLSPIGKLNAEDRELLVSRQKLFDEDAQTAQYLTMLHQLKLMHEEMGELKLKLAELKGGASSVPAPQTVVASTQATAANGKTWSNGQMLLGLFAAISLTWLWLSYIARSKAYELLPDISTKEHPAQPEIQTLKPASMITPRSKPEKSAEVVLFSEPKKNVQIAHTVDAGTPSKQPDVSAEKESPISEEEKEVLEEAELYAAYGHPDKGVKILHEFVAQHPTSEKAWLLLLSICSSRGQFKVFESAARNFLHHNKNSPSWKMMQALGRTLDQKNPLYIDENNLESSAPLSLYHTLHTHRPIGDILVELGYLSLQDKEDCLEAFDPKQHGRFGNHLVTARQISHAQLGEALMIQQAVGAERQSDTLPTLQQMESLLKDFNPQRDGSVEEFLMSRKESVAEHVARTTESGSQETRKQKIPQSMDTKEQDKYQPIDFVLDFDQDAPSIDEQPKHVVGDNSKLLEFDMELENHLARNNPRGV